MKWTLNIKSWVDEVLLIYWILKHPGSPWLAKLLASFATAYVMSPVQLLPSFVPFIGQLDDVLVIYLGGRLIKKVTPEIVMAECLDAVVSKPFWQA